MSAVKMLGKLSIFCRSASTFRTSFQHQSKDVLHYFPVHMAKGLQQMQKRLTDVDCIVEVHDARETLTGVRPHILVLNKMELGDEQIQASVEAKLLANGDIKRILYTSCKMGSNAGIKHQLLSAILDLIETSGRYHRAEADDYNILIIGIPNVGKSSLINALRQSHLHKGGRATPVGSMPGVTRSVMEKIKVCERPKVYVFDTPGIMLPNVPDMDVAMKLALCATLKDQQVGTVNVADYMLFWLNKLRKFKYVNHYGLSEPLDDIHFFLTYIAKQRQLLQKIKSASGCYVIRPNYELAASIALQDFRSGVLGKINLDIDTMRNDFHKNSAADSARTF